MAGVLMIKSAFQAWLRIYTIKNLPIAEQLASPGWIFAQWLAAVVILVVAVHMTTSFVRETNWQNKQDRRRKDYDRRKRCALT
jgi:hypothetical protein